MTAPTTILVTEGIASFTAYQQGGWMGRHHVHASQTETCSGERVLAFRHDGYGLWNTAGNVWEMLLRLV